MDHKQTDNRMNLEYRISEPDAAGNSVVDPAVRGPPGHQSVKRQGSWDRGSLEVLRFAGRVLGYYLRRDVEAGESRQTAENKKGEAEVVEGCADTDRECDYCWADAERYLQKGVGGTLVRGFGKI